MVEAKWQYIFYSPIGPHAHESAEQILQRKRNEIDSVGYTFWVANSIKPYNRIKELSKDAEVVVLCYASGGAGDPYETENIETGDINTAVEIVDETNAKKGVIPVEIKATYGGDSPVLAYKVKEIEEIEETVFNLGHYKYKYTDDKPDKPIEAWGRTFFLQNKLHFLDPKQDGEWKSKPIKFIMKLDYPFVEKLR